MQRAGALGKANVKRILKNPDGVAKKEHFVGKRSFMLIWIRSGLVK
ncbi:MAG: hypothetical protein J7539_13325 [Niabella sp.]|nr:hypothetical protein [Niabella sp.]